MAYSLRPKIESGIVAKQRISRYNGPTASNMGSCPTQIYHQIHSLSRMKKVQYPLAMKFREGNAQEDLMVSLIEDFNPGVRIVEKNVKTLKGVVGRHQVSARPDGLIYDPSLPKNSMPLIEFKSMDDHNFMKFAVLGVREAQPYYYDQLQTTMLVMRQNMKVQIPFGLMFCKLRGSEIDVWDEVVAFDEEHIDSLEERLDERDLMLAESFSPEKPFPRGHAFCNGCGAEQICWGGDEFKEESKPEISDEDWVMLRQMADAYMQFSDRAAADKKKIDGIRQWFDNQLSHFKVEEIRIPLDNALREVVAPYIRKFSKLGLDETHLRQDYPDIGKAYTVSEEVRQMRFRVERGGKTLKT